MLGANVLHLLINIPQPVVAEMVAAGINVIIQHLLMIAWKMSQIVNGFIHRILATTKGLSQGKVHREFTFSVIFV